jgi:two-component system, NtrC family, response regulator AlgB
MMMQGTEKICLRILIVDDDAGIRRTLSYCLSAEGHTVIGVSNAADAVHEAKRRAMDMVFLDLKLGNEDGMGLIPVLLSDSPWIKIVVITAYASIESAIDAIRQGAADYIAKPFTPDQVRLVTRRIARIRELELEISALKENTAIRSEGNSGQQKSFHAAVDRNSKESSGLRGYYPLAG